MTDSPPPSPLLSDTCTSSELHTDEKEQMSGQKPAPVRETRREWQLRRTVGLAFMLAPFALALLSAIAGWKNELPISGQGQGTPPIVRMWSFMTGAPMLLTLPLFFNGLWLRLRPVTIWGAVFTLIAMIPFSYVAMLTLFQWLVPLR